MQTNNRLITDYYNYSLTIDYENIKNNSYIDYLRRNVKYNENTFITKVDITLINRGAPIINNITTEQRVLNEETGETYTFPIGYYTLEELFAKLNTFCEISFFSYGEFFGRTKLETILNFTNAQELKKILGFINSPDIVSGISEDLVDITQGYEELRVYSSMIKTSDQQRCPLAVIRIDDPRSCNNFSTYCEIPINTYFLSSIAYTFENGFSQEFTPNCNIRINLSLNTFSTVTSDKVDTSYSLLTCINSGEVDSDGVYSKKLEQPIRFNSEDTFIRQTSILFDGKVYNLPEDQTLKINGKRYIIPKGSYNSRELLAKLNSLCSSLFSFVTEGENAYMLKIEDFNTINFSSAKDLASILGFTGNEYQSKEGGEKYQLITGENTFKLTVGHGIHYLDVQTGIYSESEFIRKLEKVIKTYVPDLVVKEHTYHYSFSSETYPDLKIESPLDDSQCSLHKYYWSSAVNHRKEGDNSIIPKVGCFYFDEEVTFNMLNEYFYYVGGSIMGTLTIDYCNSDGTVNESETVDLNQWSGSYSTFNFIKNFYNKCPLLSKYYEQYTYRSSGFFKRRTDYTGYIKFSGNNGFIYSWGLPTSPLQNFNMQLTNAMYRGYTIPLKGETLTITFEIDPDNPLVYTVTGTTSLSNILGQLRSLVNARIAEIYKITSGNELLLYGCPMCVWLVPNRTISSNKLKFKFGGTLIEKNWIKGLWTDYSYGECVVILAGGPTTHRLTLGYTNMEGLQLGLQKLLKEKEVGDSLQPNMKWETNNGVITARNPNALTTISVSNFNTVAYQDSARKREWCDRTEFYSPYANIEVNNDNYQITITKPNGNNQIINIPLGWYTYESLFEKFNSYLEYPFKMKDTYWLLDYEPETLNYKLEIDFLMMSSEVRVYYPNHKIYKHKFIYSDIPINITNNFENLVIYCNFIKGNNSYEKVYLTNFRIENQNGKTFLRTEQLNIPLHKGSIDYIEYILLNTDNKPFTFAGNLYISSEIVNGKIKAGTLEFL